MNGYPGLWFSPILKFVKHHKLVSGAAFKLFSVTATFLLTVLLARWLGPSVFGVYTLAVAIATIFTLPVRCGIGPLVIREIAIARGVGDWRSIHGLWKFADYFSIGYTLLVAILWFTMLHLFGIGSDVLYGPKPTLILTLLLLFSFIAIRGACITGLGYVLVGQLPEMVFKPGFMLIFLALTWVALAGERIAPVSVLLVIALASMIAFVASSYVFSYVKPDFMRHADISYRTGAWVSALIPLTAMYGVHLINKYADILIIGYFLDVGQVGVYRVSAQGAELVIFALQVVNMIMGPYLAQAYHSSNQRNLEEYVSRCVRFSVITAIPIALMLSVFGEQFLQLIFGDAFRVGAIALAILALGQLFNAFTGPVTLLLNLTGNERSALAGVLFAAAANVPLNILLVPHYGIAGAAVATAISIIIWNISMWLSVKRRVGIDTLRVVLGLKWP